MAKSRRITIATAMMLVAVVALATALVQRDRQVRRLRAQLQAAQTGLALAKKQEMLARYYATRGHAASARYYAALSSATAARTGNQARSAIGRAAPE